jgi:hypothetical protein
MSLVDILGWVATCVIITSFLVNDIKLLRGLNLVGASLWCIYAFIVGTASILVLNLILVGIQTYKLYQLWKISKESI